MTPSESLPVGIDGLALAWESVAALLGALGLGLAAGVLVRARRSRRPPRPIAAERERELESLRRIAAELAQTSDVEGVARALLDEIAALFRVGFVALAFVSEDAGEASGFLARAGGKAYLMLPLAFPILLPILFFGIKGTATSMMANGSNLIVGVVSYVIAIVTLSGMLFDKVWTDD